MQQSEETATKTETERVGVVRLERKRRVVQFEFQKSLFQIVEFTAVKRVYAREYDGLYFFITRQRLFGGVVRIGYRIADGDVLYTFDACGDISDFACGKRFFRHEVRVERSDFGNVELLAAGESLYSCADAYRSVHNAYETYDAFEVIVITVEYERGKRCVVVADGRRNEFYDLLEYLIYIRSVFG